MNLRGAGRLARRHDQTTAARKVALVTGAGKRLGRAIALALAERGWDIVVHYRHSEDEADMTALDIDALGRRALLLQCDLSDEAAVRALLPRTAALRPGHLRGQQRLAVRVRQCSRFLASLASTRTCMPTWPRRCCWRRRCTR